jgi:hypothetical protein
MQSQGLTARYVLRTPRFRACNPLNISCCEGAADSGAAPVRAATTVYSTHVREGNASRAVRGRTFRCQLKQAVPCPLLQWRVAGGLQEAAEFLQAAGPGRAQAIHGDAQGGSDPLIGHTLGGLGV